MSAAFTKTLSLLLLIGIGYFLQKKINNKDQRDGIRTLVLSLALPATILIALLQIEFASNLIIIPILSLGFNILMHFLVSKLPVKSLFNLPDNQYRTLVMLIPSLAPGLSCFPFIIEYSGNGPLAMAALADVGNKIFVLIISYTIAMKWYFEVNHTVALGSKTKTRDLLLALINEPINLVIILAIVMLALGLNYHAFPEAITISIDRLSVMMTPLVLLFIGLSMKLVWSQVRTIFSFLFFRSGIALALSGVLLYFFPVHDIPTILLIVVFPQSACSFWPYAHMAAVSKIEGKLSGENRESTFDQDFAMNVLACSLPFSVVLIMIVYASGEVFTRPAPVLLSSIVLLLISAIIAFLSPKMVVTYRKNMSSELDSAKDNVKTVGSQVSVS